MQFRLSIKKKIVLSAILVGLLPGILVMGLTYHYGTSILRNNIGENFKEITKGAAREIVDILGREIYEAYHLTMAPGVEESLMAANSRYGVDPALAGIKALDARWGDLPPDDPALKSLMDAPVASYLRKYMTVNPAEYINVTLLDIHGIAVASADKPRRLYWGDSPEWKAGMQLTDQNAFFSDLIETADGDYGIELAVPVRSKAGESVGVVLIEFRLEQLFSAINSIMVGQTGHANLVRSDGMMLIDPLIPPMSLKIEKGLLDLVALPEAGWTVADDEHGGMDAVMGHAPVTSPLIAPGSFGGHQWYVFLGLSPDETYAPFTTFLAKLAGLALVFTILVSAFAYIVAERIIRPLKSLKVGADMIGQGKLDYRLDIRTGDEIESLANDFNRMAENLRESRHTLMEWNAQLEEEIKRRTYDLRIANEELRRADRMKSEFLTNMSHELRTPLNSIIGFSEVLMDNLYGDLNEKQQRYVSNVHVSGQHLLQLISDILDLSKVEAGKMELYYNSISMKDFLANIVAAFRVQSQQKQLAMSYHVEEVEEVTADITRLKQILFNLVSNAVKFTPDHGSIEIAARPRDEFVEISVKDSGIGIRKEDQQIIFQEFRQLDASFTRKYEGTGLGLALTRKLVELHGGKVWVESEEGRGSTFFVLLPNREKVAKQTTSGQKNPAGSPSGSTNPVQPPHAS